jgi:predicted nuclease of predicted toxin-antitoxin system
MRFKIDENLPVEVAELLAAAGHDAATVYDEGVAGTTDPDLAALSQREHRVLVTLDLGFADIRSYPPRDSPGFIVLRLPRQDKTFVLQTCARLVESLTNEQLAGCLWIVEPNRIRVRSGRE